MIHHSRGWEPLILLFLFWMIASGPCCAQSAHYRHHSSVVLNDLRTTPGTPRTDGVSDICTTPTGTIRHVTRSMKKQVCASYGIPAERQNFEIDHLIPLELGGSNNLTNLWPQPYRPRPGAREKDVL